LLIYESRHANEITSAIAQLLLQRPTADEKGLDAGIAEETNRVGQVLGTFSLAELSAERYHEVVRGQLEPLPKLCSLSFVQFTQGRTEARDSDGKRAKPHPFRRDAIQPQVLHVAVPRA